ncbi:hypothetical protein ACHAWF_004790 [Thalassiosira exigua]
MRSGGGPGGGSSSSSDLGGGLALSLPAGTASLLESSREEELLRRRRRRGETATGDDRGEDRGGDPAGGGAGSSNPPPSPPPRRRLAPRRKATGPPSAARASPSPGFEASAGGTAGLRIDVSGEGGSELPLDDDGPRDGGGLPPAAAVPNVADWTLREAHRIVEEEGDEEEDAEEGEREYRGEIESVPSDSGEIAGDSDDAGEGEGDDEGRFRITLEEDVVLDPPPPTSPLVLVDLGALCGCAPDTHEMRTVLARQVAEALLGPSAKKDGEVADDDDGNDDEKKNHQDESKGGDGEKGGDDSSKAALLGDGLSLDFDDRVADLFGSDTAAHVDSSHPEARAMSSTKGETNEGRRSEDEPSRYAVVPYPEFLSGPSDDPSNGRSSRSTRRLWKLLHAAPVSRDDATNALLVRLFGHLRDTSRSLLWKADMHRELSLLARREHLLCKERERRRDYDRWRTETRRERLEKLYEVRETFELRAGMARKRYEALAGEREERVERELRRRGLTGPRSDSKGNVTNHSLIDDGRDNDAGGSLDEGYDSDGWGGTVQEKDVLGEESNRILTHYSTDERDRDAGDEGDENEEWSPLNVASNPVGMNISVSGAKGTTSSETAQVGGAGQPADEEDSRPKPNELEPISREDNLRRKTERLRKKREQQSAASESNDNLKSQEESIREMLKTNDERIAEAALRELEARLRKADELLERMQEEEWADEEEGDEEGDVDGRAPRVRRDGETPEEAEEEEDAGPNLLDQVLAMILGALPKGGLGMTTSGKEETMSDEEHYRRAKEEHDAIAQGWMEAFGRLPPFPSAEGSEPEMEPKEERKTEPPSTGVDVKLTHDDGFSIPEPKSLEDLEKERTGADSGVNALALVGNEDSNWDEVEDWDSMFP